MDWSRWTTHLAAKITRSNAACIPKQTEEATFPFILQVLGKKKLQNTRIHRRTREVIKKMIGENACIPKQTEEATFPFILQVLGKTKLQNARIHRRTREVMKKMIGENILRIMKPGR
ncbi:uncharacterized protein LOC124369395 [Homalodisca vitripennis]|uniref:uncharacterized protein LOC124369395 n=1 Tax=Homalodisca vitripennis TaxID=197043 RepID=UPI001EEAE415|nr:uncharacterized protein LOC124369395 [Homalodisca vitripennis]